ncbi:MAG: transcriptional regulator BolA [Rickettsiaceae bacterium]|jgi:BolA protein|nr:transcriptional regulator BolA [Rickettsiaceae bacterium]
MKERITKKLSQNFTIKSLEVINKSHLHQGHLGDDGSGETHFDIVIHANELVGNSVQNHRKINQLLKEEFEKNGLHALSIKIGN